MKKNTMITLLLILLFFAVSCKKEPRKSVGITGAWELAEVKSTKAVDAFGTQVSVYVEFLSDGSFKLYQLIGKGHYQLKTGTYVYSGGKLSGKYDGGDNLGSEYSVTLKDDEMVLISAGGMESDTYKKIAEIPASVISDVL